MVVFGAVQCRVREQDRIGLRSVNRNEEKKQTERIKRKKRIGVKESERAKDERRKRYNVGRHGDVG